MRGAYQILRRKIFSKIIPVNTMKKFRDILILFFLSVLLFSGQLFSAESGIEGTWQYSLTVNGTRVGSSYVDVKKNNAEYLTSTEMTISIGRAVTIVKYFHRETLDFKPVKSTSITTVVTDDNIVQREVITADFSERKVTLTDGNDKMSYEFEEDFYISENIVTSIFIKNKMKTGLKEKIKYYSPELDPAVLFDLEEEIIGKETVEIAGTKMELIHSIEKIGNVSTIHNYFDLSGVLYKCVFQMMNNEYILEKIK